jgi:5-methylthioadenosine/S-adenosylhomocysteine deaminase
MSEVSRRDLLNTAAAAAAGLSLPMASCAGRTASDPRELAQIQGARRMLLKNAVILTLDPAIGDLGQGDVLIENGKIAQIAPRIDAPPESTAIVDMTNRIIIPGFIDTHVHSYQGLLRSLLPSGRVDPEYNRDIQNNLTLHYRPEDVYAGVLITALSLIENGTTTIVDISQIAHSPEHSDANIQALKDSGIRAVFAYSRGEGPAARYPGDLIRLRNSYFNSSDQLLTLAMATSVDPNSFQFARANGVRSVLHIRVNSEPLLALGRAGLLRPGDEFIHCTHLTPQAWALIRDSGGRTSHCPPLEMAMGHGYPAIQDALDHGLRPSLSSDHSATVAQDMFGIMRAGFDLQRLAVLQRAMRKEENLPPLLTPREVLGFATIEGARCAALDAKTGSLSPGKDADLVVLRADRLDVWPRNNAYGTVVNLMNPGHVEAVFIAGKVRKWQGSLVGVDITRVIAMVEQSRNEVLRRGNFTPNLLG